MRSKDWDFGYWLALNTLPNALDPYHEHRHVEINGRLLRPARLKTDRVEVSLFPSSSLLKERRKDPQTDLGRWSLIRRGPPPT
ncbi:hypothetical protein ABIF79_009944 [Bradyrhizobium japonicum]